MNINNSGFYVKKENLNLDVVNKVKDEVIETSETISNLPTSEAEPQEQLLIPSSQQILMNNGVKINYLSQKVPAEIVDSTIEENKIIDTVSQTNKSTDTKTDDNPAEAQTSGTGKGWRIFKFILKTVSFLLNPIIGAVVRAVTDWIDTLRK